MFWLCEGDEAWSDGYLLGGDRLMELLDKEELVEELVKQRDSYQDLVDKYKNQRDEYKALRESLQDLLDNTIDLLDEYKDQRERTEEELVIVENKYLDEARRNAELEGELDGSWATWEVGLLSAGIGAVCILVGVGIAAITYEVK